MFLRRIIIFMKTIQDLSDAVGRLETAVSNAADRIAANGGVPDDIVGRIDASTAKVDAFATGTTTAPTTE